MARGGARPGAGRPKGRRSDKTVERLEAIAAAGITPLDYLLGVMRDVAQEPAVRLDAAKSAAPYVHPKLASIEHSGEVDLSRVQDLSAETLQAELDRVRSLIDGEFEARTGEEEPSELH